MDIIKKIYKKIEKEDKLIILTTLIIGLINFFYLLNNHVLSPDGLAYGLVYKSNGWEVDLGRPLLLIVDRIRGGLVSPPIILFTSLFIISISVMLLRRIFKIEKKIPIILLTILLVLFPTVSESALFIYCFDSYSLALLSSILAIYFIQKEKNIFAIASIIISLSLYQAYISVTLTGICALYILELIDNKNDYKKFIKNGIIVFVGLLSYFILLKTGMFIFGRELATYKGASSFGIDTIINLPRSIANAYIDFFSFFFKETVIYNSYYYRNILNIIIYIVLILVLFINCKKNTIINNITLIIILLIYPIATNIMNLIACDTTINLVTGIGFVMFYIIVLKIYTTYIKKDLFQLLSIILLLYLSYTHLLSNNGTFMARQDTYNNYYTKSLEILNKANNLEEYDETLPWMFSDIIRYRSNLLHVSNGYLAKDYETYESYGGIDETNIFFDHYFGKRIQIVDIDKYHEIGQKEEFKEMKIGDVKIIDSVVVVKLSEDLPF